MRRTTTLLLLQPGDRISLDFHAFTIRGSGRPRMPDDAAPVPPAITRPPFRVDADDRFNAWIAPWLP